MEIVHFRTCINFWVAVIILGSLLVCVVTCIILLTRISKDNLIVNLMVLVITILSGGLLGWIWFDTAYHLQAQGLRYYSGPVRGFIRYESICKIEVGKTAWIGTRPALATRGIIVHYNTYAQVYLSPDTNECFEYELGRRVEKLEIQHHV